MQRKTEVHAGDGEARLVITREFDLPVELLFRAHADGGLFAEWMSHESGTTRVTRFDARRHGVFRFETCNADGNVLFAANGVFHDFIPHKKITRTFEMENTAFDVQLEFLEFIKRSDESSKLRMETVFRSAQLRDQLLKMPFAQGLSMAHDRLQQIVQKLK